MLLRNAYPIRLFALLGALVPTGTSAAVEAPNAVVPIHVTASAEPNRVRVSGAIAGVSRLQAVLYATFSPEIPGVLLSRRSLPIDADGNFDATIPIAPAYFTGAIITVTVQNSAGVTVGRGSITITDP